MKDTKALNTGHLHTKAQKKKKNKGRTKLMQTTHTKKPSRGIHVWPSLQQKNLE